jgi:hypothetical protein
MHPPTNPGLKGKKIPFGRSSQNGLRINLHQIKYFGVRLQRHIMSRWEFSITLASATLIEGANKSLP